MLARWFADATCQTCRIALFHVWRGEGNAKDIPHTHTQDELIYLVGGSIVMGSYTFGPGTCLAIPADRDPLLVLLRVQAPREAPVIEPTAMFRSVPRGSGPVLR